MNMKEMCQVVFGEQKTVEFDLRFQYNDFEMIMSNFRFTAESQRSLSRSTRPFDKLKALS